MYFQPGEDLACPRKSPPSFPVFWLSLQPCKRRHTAFVGRGRVSPGTGLVTDTPRKGDGLCLSQTLLHGHPLVSAPVTLAGTATCTAPQDWGLAGNRLGSSPAPPPLWHRPEPKLDFHSWGHWKPGAWDASRAETGAEGAVRVPQRGPGRTPHACPAAPRTQEEAVSEAEPPGAWKWVSPLAPGDTTRGRRCPSPVGAGPDTGHRTPDIGYRTPDPPAETGDCPRPPRPGMPHP